MSVVFFITAPSVANMCNLHVAFLDIWWDGYHHTGTKWDDFKDPISVKMY